MLYHLFIAASLIVATTILHAGGMMWSLRIIKKTNHHTHTHLIHTLVVSRIVLLMFIVSFLEVLLWAETYRQLGALDGMEEAVYFSMVTYTTLGYGDITLDQNWRLLSSFEAANGIIMFGWTTAILISAVTHIYFGDKSPLSGK